MQSTPSPTTSIYPDSVNERAVSIYCTLIDVGCIPSVLLFFYVLHTVVSQSPPYMHHSRWMLINIAASCFLVDLVLWVWKPVTVPHTSYFYSNGFPKHMPAYVSTSLKNVGVFALGNLVHSLMLYMAYRYSRILPAQSGGSFRFLSSRRQFVLFSGVTWLLTPVAAVVMNHFSTDSQAEVDAWLRTWPGIVNSSLKEIYPTVESLSSSWVGRSPVAFVGEILTVVGCLCCATTVVVLNVKHYRMLKRHSHDEGGGKGGKASTRTRQLQWMLYKAQTVQLLTYFAFQVLPLAMVYPLCTFGELIPGLGGGISYADYTMFALGLTSFHSFADYFAILFFIRPYREYTADWLRFLLWEGPVEGCVMGCWERCRHRRPRRSIPATTSGMAVTAVQRRFHNHQTSKTQQRKNVVRSTSTSGVELGSFR